MLNRLLRPLCDSLAGSVQRLSLPLTPRHSERSAAVPTSKRFRSNTRSTRCRESCRRWPIVFRGRIIETAWPLVIREQTLGSGSARIGPASVRGDHRDKITADVQVAHEQKQTFTRAATGQSYYDRLKGMAQVHRDRSPDQDNARNRDQEREWPRPMEHLYTRADEIADRPGSIRCLPPSVLRADDRLRDGQASKTSIAGEVCSHQPPPGRG